MYMVLASFLIIAFSIVAAPVVGVGTAMGLYHLGGAMGKDARIRETCELDNRRFSSFKNSMKEIKNADDLYFRDFCEQGKYTSKSQIIGGITEVRKDLARRRI